MNSLKTDTVKDSISSGLPPLGGLYYARLSRKYRIAKYVTLAVLIIFIILTAITGHDGLKAENFRYLFKYTPINSDTSSYYYTEIEYKSASDADFALYKGDLAVLGDGTLTLYNMEGTAILSSHDCGDSIDASGKYMAVYTRGGYNVTLFNSFSSVFKAAFDNPVYLACGGADGSLVIVTLGDAGNTLYIYNKNFKLVYTWTSSDKLIFDIDISDDGKEVAFFTLSSENGAAKAELIVKEIAGDKTVADIVYNNTTPLGVKFFADKSFTAVCSDFAGFYSAGGDEREIIKFGGGISRAAFTSDTAAFLFNGAAGSHLEVYSRKGKPEYEYNTDERIYRIASNGDFIYLLANSRVYIINHADKKAGSISVTENGLGIFPFDDGNLLICYPQSTKLIAVSDIIS